MHAQTIIVLTGELTSRKSSLLHPWIVAFQALSERLCLSLPAISSEFGRFSAHTLIDHARLPPETLQIHISMQVALIQPQTEGSIHSQVDYDGGT